MAGCLCALSLGAAEPGPVTSFADYYALNPGPGFEPRPVRVEASVLYYDHVWRVMFLQDGTGGFFMDVPQEGFGVTAGQRVMVEGQAGYAPTGRVLTRRVLSVLPDAPMPDPLETDIARLNSGAFPNRWVATTGDILWIREQGHLLEGRITDGTNELDFVWKQRPAEAIHLWLGATARFNGAAAMEYANERPVRARLFVPRVEDVSLIHPAIRSPFQQPVRTIQSLKAATTNNLPVHVSGTVESIRARVLRLRDETGQVTARAIHPLDFPIGSRVNVAGLPARQQAEAELIDAVVVPAWSTESQGEPAPDVSLAVIQRIDEIRSLTQAESARRHPVDVTGVVTYRFAGWGEMFLQDDSAGIYVSLGSLELNAAVGHRVRVQGTTDPGGYAPVIVARTLEPLGPGELPPASRRSLSELRTGIHDSQWVEMIGVVQSATNSANGMFEAQLRNRSGTFGLRLPRHLEATNLIDTQIRMRGVVASSYNEQRELTNVEIRVPGPEFLTIEQTPPSDPFALTTGLLGELRQFRASGDAPSLVKVRGVVTGVRPDGSFYLQDRQRGVLVIQRQRQLREPGEEVEAVGYFEPHLSSALLVEALVRPVGRRQLPVPLPVNEANLLVEANDQMWSRVRGRYAGMIRRGQSQVFLLQLGNWIIEAAAPGHHFEPGLEPALGSLVEFHGVLAFNRDLLNQLQGINLEMNAPAPAAVLERPPQWTAARIRTLAVCLVLVAGVGFWRYRSTTHHNRKLQREIDERRDAERRLVRNQFLLRTLMENSPDYIYLKDTESRFVQVNRATASKAGFSRPETMVGLTDFDLFDEVSAREFREDELSVMRTGTAIVAREEREVSRDGKVRWMESTTIPHYDEAGQVCGIIGIARDITARKQADEDINRQKQLYQVMFDAMPALVLYKDTCNRVVRINRFGAALLGQPADEIEGRSLFEIDPEHADRLYEDDLEVIRTGAPKLGLEEIVGTASGRTVWLRTDKLPDRNAAGEIVGVVIFAVDTTAQKLAENALLQSQEELESKVRDRTAALEQQINERQEAELRLREQERFIRTVMDTNPNLIFVKDRSGKFTLVNAAVCQFFGRREEEIIGRHPGELGFTGEPLRTMEREELAVWRQQRERKPVEETLDDTPGGSRWWQTVRRPLFDQKGAMTHLLGVSMDITARRLASEELNRAREAAEAADRHKGEFLAAVSREVRTPMQGVIGMTRLLLAAGLNDEQKQLAANAQQSADELLSIITRLLEFAGAHGARKVNGLDPRPSQPAQPPAEAATNAARTSSPAARARMRVLVAEDNAINQQVAVGTLRKLGYDADCVANGREVLSAVESILYDVILMDCNMPELDGYQTTQAIRGQSGWKQPYIIAMTANAMAGDREKCLAAGMNHYLSKPVREQDLDQLLASLPDNMKPSEPAPSGRRPAAATPPARVVRVDANAVARLRELGEPGGPDLAAEFIDLYLADGRAMVDRLREASPDDRRLLKRQAHTLKGSSRNLGAETVAEIAREIESQADSAALDELAKLTAQLEQAFAETAPLLEQLKSDGVRAE